METLLFRREILGNVVTHAYTYAHTHAYIHVHVHDHTVAIMHLLNAENKIISLESHP